MISGGKVGKLFFLVKISSYTVYACKSTDIRSMLLILLHVWCRSVLFWDIRPPVQKKANETNKPKATVASDQPFSYLDLTWKPFLKV